MRTRLSNMTWSNLRFNVLRSFVTMATNVPFCVFSQFLEQPLKFLTNFTLLKYVKSQRSYGFLITKKLIFGFQILDLKIRFSASLTCCLCWSRFLSFQANLQVYCHQGRTLADEKRLTERQQKSGRKTWKDSAKIVQYFQTNSLCS